MKPACAVLVAVVASVAVSGAACAVLQGALFSVRNRITYPLVCMYTCVCVTCPYIYMCVCVCVCMYVCMYACMSVCVHACMHIFIGSSTGHRAYTYTHIICAYKRATHKYKYLGTTTAKTPLLPAHSHAHILILIFFSLISVHFRIVRMFTYLIRT